MILRRTLNGQPPRTLRDAARDPFDWLEAPASADTHERRARAAERAMLLLAVACAAWWLWEALA
ncbi:MAG TPA: hypothetical protein PKA84_01360 [Rubrivivax sp.]|nr:hypothetical protein [Rubrivivax sp.]HMR68857.1 hypothetical protein [Rubrivivax sp.]